MSQPITPEELLSRMDAFPDCLESAKKPLQEITSSTAIGLMKARIFNDGKDANEKSLGGYSVPYAKKRIKRGRQVSKKDLQMTDQLFNSIKILKKKGDTFVGIEGGKRVGKRNLTNQQLAPLLEAQEDTTIFVLSANELKKVLGTVPGILEKTLKNCF